MGDEREPPLWQAAVGGLDELDRIASSEDRATLARLTHRILVPIADELGWSPAPGEGDVTRRLRGLVLAALGTFAADPEVVQEAAVMVDRWFAESAGVDADVAAASLMIVGGNGGREEYERFMAARGSAVRPQDAVRLLRAAAAVPDRSTALELLDMVVDGRVRRQDAYWVVARLLGHRDVGGAVWQAVRGRWGEVIDAMPPQNARLMLDQIHLRSEPEVADDIVAWLTANPIKGSEQLIAQQVERLQVRVGLRDRERPRLGEALEGL
jgi:aminopeptidase N